MPRIFPVTIIRRVVEVVGGGAAQFLASVLPAIAVDATVSGTLDEPAVTPALVVTETPATLLVDQKPALDVDLIGATGTADQQDVAPALAVSTVLDDYVEPQTPAIATSLLGATGTPANPAVNPAPVVALLAVTGTADQQDVNPAPSIVASARSSDVKPAQTPAANIVQVVYSLNGEYYPNVVAAQEGGCTGRTDWANTDRALGEADGLAATLVGNALGARDGIIVLNLADFPNKGELTITQVLLHYWGSQAGTTLNNGDFDYRYRHSGGAWTVLETFAGDVNHLGSPREFNLTSVLDTWAKLDSLQVGARACYATAELVTAQLDAVHLIITATKTDTL